MDEATHDMGNRVRVTYTESDGMVWVCRFETRREAAAHVMRTKSFCRRANEPMPSYVVEEVTA